MINEANETISQLTSTAQGAGALVAVVMVLIALVVGRTLVKVLSTIVLVGIVLFAVAKPDYFKDKVGEDFEGSLGRPPAAVVLGPPSPAPLSVTSSGPAAA
jgi:hypothetical protein